MRTYAFVAEDGAIVWTQTSPVPLAAPGIVEVPNGTRDDLHYFVGDDLRKYTRVQREARAAAPRHKARWDARLMQWVDLRTAEERTADARAAVIAQIEALEATQGRALREAALGQPERLQQIEAQIAALRAYL